MKTNNPVQRSRLGSVWLEKSFIGKDLVSRWTANCAGLSTLCAINIKMQRAAIVTRSVKSKKR